MKRITNTGVILMIASILLVSCAGAQGIAQKSGTSAVTYQTFYDDLSPFGTWIDYPPYNNVWHPNVTEDFRPYLTNGYWNYTNEGNLWMSDYSWGWGPFHYGRWVYDDFYGWLWVPGYEWSPAWVTWGMMDGYYAWAPLLPGINAGISFGSWRPTPFYWNVVGQNNLYNRHVFSVAESRNNVNNYVNHISIVNNFGTTGKDRQYYSKGPDRDQYQKRTGKTIQPFTIREANSARANRQSGNDVQVYRPIVVHPQPQQSRRLDNIASNPATNADDHMATPREQQMKNINRLPVHTAPVGTYENRNANRQGNGRRRN